MKKEEGVIKLIEGFKMMTIKAKIKELENSRSSNKYRHGEVDLEIELIKRNDIDYITSWMMRLEEDTYAYICFKRAYDFLVSLNN